MIQLDIAQELARLEAEEGMSRALGRAERQTPNWGSIALEFLRKYAKANARFAGWMVVKAAGLDPNFPTPPNEKAWGAPIKQAARMGIIRRVGTTRDPHRHGNPIALWESTVYEGAPA